MSGDENHPSPSDPSCKRSVFALCNYPALLVAGILRLEELQDSPIEDYLADMRREHRVFVELVDSYPGLLDHLTNGEEEDIIHVGELLGKGASGARGDDTKTLKSAVLKWLMPRGQAVIPPLSRNIKSNHGFNNEVTGALLCPTGLDWSNVETKQSLKSGETAVCGDQWPIFLYAVYDYNPKDPWKGLLRSEILIFGFKHVFTSPSSMDKEPKATRSGNAYLHGMKFSLNLSSVLSHMDTITNSENFYHSILDLLEDPDESEEVADLMMWWTRFHTISSNSALLKIHTK
ncbi:hypothetical protein EDB19DRAFT_1896981 [Suillus lakei]|nr:hypothetical protein EDB19DRAFT_1896981 [Suillus lakei]